MKIQNKIVKKSRWKIEIKKSHHRKVVKAKKRQNPKNESVLKKLRLLEPKTLANQECSLLPMLGEPLLN